MQQRMPSGAIPQGHVPVNGAVPGASAAQQQQASGAAQGPGQGAGRERKIEPDVCQVPVPRLVRDVRGGMSKNDLRKGRRQQKEMQRQCSMSMVI